MLERGEKRGIARRVNEDKRRERKRGVIA